MENKHWVKEKGKHAGVGWGSPLACGYTQDKEATKCKGPGLSPRGYV